MMESLLKFFLQIPFVWFEGAFENINKGFNSILKFGALLFEYGFGNFFQGLFMLALPLLPAWLFIQPKLEDWWYFTFNTFNVPAWKWWAVWSFCYLLGIYTIMGFGVLLAHCN